MKTDNENHVEDISELFRLALRHYIHMQTEKKFKSNLVKGLNDEGVKISFSNFSNFLNKKTSLSEKKRARIAHHLGFKYEEFILLGRRLVELKDAMPMEKIGTEALYLNRSTVEIFKEIQKRYKLSGRDISNFLNMDFIDYQFRLRNLIPFNFDEIATVFEKVGKRYPDFNNPIKKSEAPQKSVSDVAEDIKKMSPLEKEVVKSLIENE
ncbi:hypothetical protein EPICR_30113 [Candidatus Desulfarcum epimagneticum]|uniref:Uncharacterized protein n=1 Tax=uncultured Desulfobacteraceae bacterium TaxID=218296 RepID=A0A484HG38_9BACT|nr:hypothetical protein EPICR_30113 [uncultured Desulfobacteraceae bacterium]